MPVKTAPIANEFDSPEMRLAEWTGNMKRSVIREMLAVAARPGILSFAGGLPAPELFPVKEYSRAVEYVLANDPRALQYGPPFPPLKSHIVNLMEQRGVACSADQVFITTGAQQALNVLTRLYLDQGGTVMVEEIVYTGIQQALSGYDARILTIPSDLEIGIDTGAIEAYIRAGERPAFLYAISEAHNPLGVSISAARKAKLVELARMAAMPIVEDDPYGFLYYDEEAGLPIRALDEKWVIYVGSFSKILAPALRLGWMIIPEHLLPKLTVLKEALDLETSAFIQRTVSAYLDAGHLPNHLIRLREEYRLRRDTMLASLELYFPPSARWTKPSGGMFIWVELPGHVDTVKLLGIAVNEEGVAYIPGSAFCVETGMIGRSKTSRADNCLRLNFSKSDPEMITSGIARLGRILHRYI